MSFTESFYLKLTTAPIIGIGTIVLGWQGILNPEAVTAILGAMVGFFVDKTISKAAGAETDAEEV